jgi:hypothetical protein
MLKYSAPKNTVAGTRLARSPFFLTETHTDTFLLFSSAVSLPSSSFARAGGPHSRIPSDSGGGGAVGLGGLRYIEPGLRVRLYGSFTFASVRVFPKTTGWCTTYLEHDTWESPPLPAEKVYSAGRGQLWL